MGNEESKDITGETIQTQGPDCLWTIVLTGNEDEEDTGDQETGGESSVCCIFTSRPEPGTEFALCSAGVEHLRLLRHPNILKFLGSEKDSGVISMVTEPVIPVINMLGETSMECVVMGLRGVANGLEFLHSKAGLSHNNLSMLSVYVSTLDSQWKIGGFETALHHKKIDAKFLSVVAGLRYKKAIPPEDNSKSATVAPSSYPCHARDIWAFGKLVLAVLDKSALDAHASDSLFLYVQDKMLNLDPNQRPTASQVAAQPWMRNEACQIFDFLSNLTVKTKQQKLKFFGALAEKIYSLPPLFVAEHLVPLIINPLVMAEPLERETLWKHLLTPVSDARPRPKVFDQNRVCPLLDEELFVGHVIPLILDLMESHELHVRIVLLENIGGYAPICDQEDLEMLILPEVLLGLKDYRVEMIQATLHALGDLVPLVGTEAVLGSSTQQLFTDAKPRGSPPEVGVVDKPPSYLPSRAPAYSTSTATRGSREERKERMRMKREQQKLKRQTQPKLGKLTGTLLARNDSEGEVDETTPIAPPTTRTSDHTSQYSPSISHDEKENEESWEGLEEELAENGSYTEGQDIHRTHQGGAHLYQRDSTKEDDESEEWEEFEDDSVTSEGGVAVTNVSGEGSWHRSQMEDDIRPSRPIKTPSKSSSRSGGMKLKIAPSSSSRNTSTSSSPLTRSKVTTKDTKELRSTMKGRLSEEDIQRLEVQAAWSKEPDFFADMEPTVQSQTTPSTTGSDSIKSTPIVGGSGDTSSGHSLSSAMQYEHDEQEGDGWGDGGDDWNDF